MICKKYTAEFKKALVKEYLETIKDKKISKAEFASQKGVSDSTFNDWVIKYQRDEQGFCNITNEIAKLDDVEIIDTTIEPPIKPANEEIIMIKEDWVKLTYNGATIEFNQKLLERVLKELKSW